MIGPRRGLRDGDVLVDAGSLRVKRRHGHEEHEDRAGR
jgi:hypothetical protein